MKKLCKYVLFLVVGIAFVSNARAENFIEGLEDVPVMSGLYQLKNDGFSFGNEEGRFVEALLEGNEDIYFDEVKDFYKETLPQLGWQFQESGRTNALIFLRDGESLELEEDNNKPLKVRITVKSKN